MYIKNSLLLCLIFLFSSSVFAQTGTHVPEMVGVDSVFQGFMNKWNVPGGSMAVVKDGRLIYARGFGYADTSSKELVQPKHSFRVASVSKTITAMAIMTLVDDELLSLDDFAYGSTGILNDESFSTILDSSVTTITVKHLLQHTSGWGFINNVRDPVFFSHNIANQMGVSSPVGESTIIEYMLSTQMLKSTPGETYFYSNFGFLTLGKIIEKITGQGYEDYVRSKLLVPSGADEMFVGKNRLEDKSDSEVHYYDYQNAPLAVSIYDINARVSWPYGGFNIEAMGALGGWVATPTDLLKLLLRVDGLESVPDLISSSSVNLMSTSSQANDNYALGWGVNSNNTWWHLGSLSGTTAAYVRTNNGYGWMAVLNTRPSGGSINAFNNEFDVMLWQALQTVTEWPTHDLFLQSTSIDENELESPVSFQLDQNYPNPFNPSTTIQYTLGKSQNVSLIVYDLKGQVIDKLVSDYKPAGVHQLSWDASEYASGVYFYTLIMEDGASKTKKLLLIK